MELKDIDAILEQYEAKFRHVLKTTDWETEADRHEYFHNVTNISLSRDFLNKINKKDWDALTADSKIKRK